MREDLNIPDKKVLNVGGHDKNILIPDHYNGWQHLILDIDPHVNSDVHCDARELSSLAPSEYDAIYCSHNLEHYYRHEVPKVLQGFLHLLKEDGFAEIRVPDLKEVMKTVIEKGLDIDDILYQSPAGPIAVRDVFYGYGVEIERSGQDYFAHKTGFTQKSLKKILYQCGFPIVYSGEGNFEIRSLAFKQQPTDFHQTLLEIQVSPR